MLKRLRIGPKLWLAPGAVLLLLVLLSSAAYLAMLRQHESLNQIVRERAPHQRGAAELVTTVQQAHAGVYRLLAWIGGSFPRARTDPLLDELRRRHADGTRGLAELARLEGGSAEERRHVAQAGAAWARYLRAVGEVMELARNDQSISANAMQKAETAFADLARRLGELAALEQRLAARAADQATAEFHLGARLMPAVLLLSIGLSLAITVAVRRALLDEIGAIGAAAQELASGDLTVKPRDYGSDEIAETARVLDASIGQLNATLRTVLASARSIGSASREIKLGELSISSRAVYRASSRDLTVSSMQELAATVHLTADSVQAARRLTDGAAAAAAAGQAALAGLDAALDGARDDLRAASRLARDLALLAHECGDAALDCALRGTDAALPARLQAIAARAMEAAHALHETSARTDVRLDALAGGAAQAGDEMARLDGAVARLGDLILEIDRASAGQASGLTEVNQAIVQMDQASRHNAALVAEAAEAARRLQAQAGTLARAVAAFRLDEAPLDAPPQTTTAPAVAKHDRRRHPARAHLRLAVSRD